MPDLIVQAIPFMTVHLIPAVIMMLKWSGSASRLYAHAIAQPDGMLSAEKDLADRISISPAGEIAAISARVNELARIMQGHRGAEGSIRRQLEMPARLFQSVRTASACSGRIDAALRRTVEISGIFRKKRALRSGGHGGYGCYGSSSFKG